MGLFDFLTGKKAAAAAPTPAALTPREVAQSRSLALAGVDWSFSNAQARALVTELLTRAAPGFGTAHVKELPDDSEIDLRGTYAGSPIRFAVDMTFGRFGKIEVMCPNHIGFTMIHRDYEKIPKPRDPGDPFSDDEDRRIFLAKGIFVEGDDDEVAMYLATWSKLPVALQAHALAEIERLGLLMVQLLPKNVTLIGSPDLADLADPIDYMQSSARFLAELGGAVSQGDGTGLPTSVGVAIRGAVEIGASPGPAQQAAIMTLVCKYCTTVFVLTAGNNVCPNCGAPASQ